jgi:hypothetical protein
VITVTGSAKQRIQSDYVVWTAGVSSQDPSAAAAVGRLTAWTGRVRAFLQSEGIEAGELSLQPVSTDLTPGSTDNNGNRTKDYRLTRRFEVRSSRVDAVAQMAERSAKLLAQGVPLAADPPQYVYTKLPSLRPQLLSVAIKDAQRRAHVIVEASGAKLGNVRGVDVGVFQITSPNSTTVSDYGAYDTATVAKDVTAVVNVTFALGH